MSKATKPPTTYSRRRQPRPEPSPALVALLPAPAPPDIDVPVLHRPDHAWESGIGSLAEWLEQARADYAVVMFAVHTMRCEELGLKSVAWQMGPEALGEMAAALGTRRTRYAAMADLMGAALSRALGGASGQGEGMHTMETLPALRP